MSIFYFKLPDDTLCLAQSGCIGGVEYPPRSSYVVRGFANEPVPWPPPYPPQILETPSQEFCMEPVLGRSEAMCKGNQNRFPLPRSEERRVGKECRSRGV